MTLIDNIDNDTALGDIRRCRVSLSTLLKRSILDSSTDEYAIYSAKLNIIADNSPVRNDIEKAALYENSFQTYFCLKKNVVTVEPNRGMR